MVVSRFYNWKILWPYVLLECESIWNVVPLRPGRGDVRQILSPLSSFVANGSPPVSLSLSLYLSLSLSLSLLRFCSRKSSRRPSAMSLVFTRLRAFTPRRYSRSLAQRPLALVVCRRVLTDFHRSEIARGTGTAGGECGVLTYNASIKVKRRAYVQRTWPSCSTESVQQLRVKGTIKNVLRQVKVGTFPIPDKRMW
jgi:hypothetical protein